MEYDRFDEDCYSLYTIKTDKFKSCHLEVIFRNPSTKENITYLALLFDTLIESTRKYPSKKLLSRRLQDLYNLNIYSVNSRVGNTLITNLVVDFLDPIYMEKGTLEDIISLLFSILFDPNVNVDEFDEDTFNRVKNRLKDEINSLKEDPKQSSILTALSKLDSTSPRSFNSSGDLQILEDITPNKLYKFYKKVMDEALVDIYAVGNLDMKLLDKLIRKYSKFNSIKLDNLKLYLDDIDIKKKKSYRDSNSLTQTNLVELYTFKNLSEREMNYCVPIFNMLWGSGSLESKLYKKVRGENSLCYNINTYYQKYDKVIVLHTAVDSSNVPKTEKLIKSCLDDMKKGIITEEELDNVKNILITSLNLIYDSPSRLVDNYLFKNIASLKDVENRIEEFKKVTIDDLIKLSKKIYLILSYRVGD